MGLQMYATRAANAKAGFADYRPRRLPRAALNAGDFFLQSQLLLLQSLNRRSVGSRPGQFVADASFEAGMLALEGVEVGHCGRCHSSFSYMRGDAPVTGDSALNAAGPQVSLKPHAAWLAKA
jgi:hypothetical protein